MFGTKANQASVLEMLTVPLSRVELQPPAELCARKRAICCTPKGNTLPFLSTDQERTGTTTTWRISAFAIAAVDGPRQDNISRVAGQPGAVDGRWFVLFSDERHELQRGYQ